MINEIKPQGNLAFWKQQAPTIVMVASFVSFMNANSASIAAFFGIVACAMICWIIFASRRVQRSAGQALFRLGEMQLVGTARMTGWMQFAAVLFLFLGFAMFFTSEGWNRYARWGMAIMCWGIAGAQFSSISSSSRRLGVLAFGLSFVIAGGLLLTEAVILLRTEEHDAALTASKWAVFSSFLLLGGVPTLVGFFRGGGQTVLNENGIVTPHGFVQWESATSIQLSDADQSGTVLWIEMPRGWSYRIQVPSEQLNNVKQFVSEQQQQYRSTIETSKDENSQEENQ